MHPFVGRFLFQDRLVLNSLSFCLSLPIAWITDMNPHAQLVAKYKPPVVSSRKSLLKAGQQVNGKNALGATEDSGHWDPA